MFDTQVVAKNVNLQVGEVEDQGVEEITQGEW